MKRILLLFLLIVVLMGCVGCGKKSPGSGDSSSGQSGGQLTQTPTMAAGDAFLSSNLKIQSHVKYVGVSPERDVLVELYVDADGDGEGMLGFGETVKDVKVVKDVLYIIVDTDNVVSISDISGRMILTSAELAGAMDLSLYGFQVVNGSPVSYSARSEDTVVSTTFATTVNTFEPTSLATENVMTFNEAIDYIIDYTTDQAIGVTGGEGEEEITSFYLNSEYGLTIEGGLYSIGDTCNPSTYFGGRTPEGLLTSSAYKEDTRIDYLHASYISETGRSVFTLTGNYVQSIETTANFSWLGIESGTSMKDLEKLLGYKLSKQEQEGWEPINPDLEILSYARNVFTCKIGTLTAELGCDSKNGLYTIRLTRPLDYQVGK